MVRLIFFLLYLNLLVVGYNSILTRSVFQYILNAKNLASPFLSIFFWIKIDDFKNQCSLVFMPLQKAIVVEKIKSV